MKKIFIILLLICSFSGFSQTGKGDFVITPTLGWSTLGISNNSERDIFQARLPIGFHKYLSDRFAVGLLLNFDYYSEKPYVTNQFQRNITRIGILPEVRYNFLKTRLTPFVTGRVFYVGYINTFYDNPTTPVYLRRISQLDLTTGLQIDLGLSYFIKDRFGLQVRFAGIYNETNGIKARFNIPYNIGLQFIINNPRQ